MEIDMKKHKNVVDLYLKDLREFLMTPTHDDNGWPDIGDHEMAEANTLVDQLLSIKWGTDGDDMSPIQYILARRKLHRLVWPWTVEQERETETQNEERARLMRTVSSASSGIAGWSGELDRALKLLKYMDYQDEKRATITKL